MSACCPNCPATPLGTEIASICTECATATVGGASFSLPVMIATAICAAALVLTYQSLSRQWRRRPNVTLANA